MAHLSENMLNLALQTLKIIFLHYRDIYGHQNWQDGDLPREAPTQKVKSFFDHMVSWDHATN